MFLETLTSEAYLYGHGWEVPHIDDDGPTGHGAQQIADHVVLAAVPESITQARIVLRHKGSEGESGSQSRLAQVKHSLD